MKNRRLISALFVLIMTSVFLCSCGIPTYWQPSNSTIISKRNTADGSISFDLQVDCYSGDEIPSSSEGGVGLILLYHVSQDNYNADFSAIKKSFEKEIRGSIPNGLTTVRSELGTPVISFTDSNSDESGLYAFTMASGDKNSYSLISAPNYNLKVNAYDPMNLRIDLELDNESVNPTYLIKCSEANSLFSEFYIGYSDLSCTDLQSVASYYNDSVSSYRYIHVYAAVSAQSNSFSNIYWSDIVYVGSFEILNQ